MSRRHHYTAWLGNGDYGHTMLCQYLEYYHCTGYRPAWQMAKAFKLIAPNGKPAKSAIRVVCAPNHGRDGYYEMSVEKDGQTGTYVMPAFPLVSFGCDIAKTAFVVGNSLYGTGEPLYVRSDDLANSDGTTSFLPQPHGNRAKMRLMVSWL